MAIMLLIVLFGAAFALDLSITSSRAQSLQNAADSAALAGVQALRSEDLSNAGLDAAARATALADAQDDAKEAVAEILAQNGIDLSTVSYTVDFPDSVDNTVVRVSVSDPNPGRLLSGVTGADAAVTREATAEFESCEITCTQPIAIPRPGLAIQADGTGDGWTPLIVDNRTYALNHHTANGWLLCVDSNTQDNCWEEGPRNAYAGGVGSVYTPDVPSAAVHEGVIYWTAGAFNSSRVFCWQTATDTPCADSYKISDLPGANTRFSGRYEQDVGGLVLHEGLLYVFSGDHRVHCVVPGIPMSTCGRYDREGELADLALRKFPTNDLSIGNLGADRAFPVIDDDADRIYWKTEIRVLEDFGADNLAEGRNVVQSSTRHGGVATRAIDGNTSGVWGHGSVTHTITESQPWWQVDLGSISQVDEVELFNRAGNCCMDRLADFHVLVSNNDMQGRSLNDLLNDGSVVKVHEPGLAGASWSTALNTTGRYLRVQLAGDSEPLSLAEVVVKGVSGVPPVNAPDASYATGTWIQCWDINDAAPCSGFDSSPVSDGANRRWGRPFLQRNASGDVQAICAFVNWPTDVPCLDPVTGASRAPMTALANEIRAVQPTDRSDFMGQPLEIVEANRLYVPATFRNSTMVCWDFATGFCGSRQPLTDSGNLAQDYGYAATGDCVYALGHQSYFWSFKASDVHSDCDTSSIDTQIRPCACGGALQWGTADFDVDTDLFLRFEIRIRNMDGDQIYPADGSAHSLHTDGPTIDMTEFPITGLDDFLTVDIFVQTKVDPDSIGEQELLISFRDRPRLVS